MEKTAMKKEIRYWLPDAQAGNRAQRHETKLVIDPRCRVGGEEDRCQRLKKEDDGAGHNKVLYGWRNETAPVEANIRRAEPATHASSVRRAVAGSQKQDC